MHILSPINARGSFPKIVLIYPVDMMERADVK